MQAVPEADVIITNPTHLAAALKYDSSEMNAPKLVAKGAGKIAEKIKKLAADNKKQIISASEYAQYITDKRRAKRESDRKKHMDERNLLFTAIEQSAESVFITDRTGMIQYVNPAFERLTGYGAEEPVNRRSLGRDSLFDTVIHA